jgi:hypothetical protein
MSGVCTSNCSLDTIHNGSSDTNTGTYQATWPLLPNFVEDTASKQMLNNNWWRPRLANSYYLLLPSIKQNQRQKSSIPLILLRIRPSGGDQRWDTIKYIQRSNFSNCVGPAVLFEEAWGTYWSWVIGHQLRAYSIHRLLLTVQSSLCRVTYDLL